MRRKDRNTYVGTNLIDVVLIVFIILKLCNLIQWSWLWVLSPLLIWIFVWFIVVIWISVR